MMKDISVIIPVFNKIEYLERCVRSVLESSATEIEIICVDDCSTDGSYELLCVLYDLDERISVYRNDRNRGVSFTRNIGINKAEGRYLVFLDADDYLDANALSIWTDRLKETKAQGCFINIGIKNTYSACYSGREILSEFVCNNETFLYACGAIWETAFIKEHGIMFRDLKVGEGGLFVLEALLKAERVVCCDFRGYHYVTNSNSMSSNPNAMVYASIGQAKQIADMVLKLQPDNEDKEILQFIRWYLNKNLGGIRNLKKGQLSENKDSFSDNERLIVDMIRDENLACFLDIPEDDIETFRSKGEVYLYGAGYETLRALKICNDHDIEIKGIFVTAGSFHPNTAYGYRVVEFCEGTQFDSDIPFMITAHNKHHSDIRKVLLSAGVKNMIFLGEDY